MEKVSKKGKQRRSAPTAASTGPDPSAAVPSVSDPSASTVHVESNSPRSSSGESREESRDAPPPPPPPSTTPPPAAPVQQQQHQQHQQQQQQQHQQQQGIKVSQAGRRQFHAPSVAFDEKLNQLWAAVFDPPEGSGGPGPAHGEMEYAEYSDGTDYPEYSDPNGFIPQSQERPVHPTAQDDPGLLPSTSRGNRPVPPEDVISHQGIHPGSNGQRGRPGCALGSHARDMGPPRTSRAYGSRAIPPRSTAFIR